MDDELLRNLQAARESSARAAREAADAEKRRGEAVVRAVLDMFGTAKLQGRNNKKWVFRIEGPITSCALYVEFNLYSYDPVTISCSIEDPPDNWKLLGNYYRRSYVVTSVKDTSRTDSDLYTLVQDLLKQAVASLKENPRL